MLPDLITLQEYKDSIGLTGSGDDARLNKLIKYASVAIRSYAGRNFAASSGASTISYAYDGTGFLDIDDASAVTNVVLDGRPLTLNQDYVLGPDRGALTPDTTGVYYWLELPSDRRPPVSPEMGFMYNLDQLWQRYVGNHVVAVTATFGWPTVPDDVKLAAIWTIQDWRGAPSGEFESEHIADYGYTQGDSAAPDSAIPSRARDLLSPYKRV